MTDRQGPWRIAAAGCVYFIAVLAAGFVLGPIRVLWLAPRVGSRYAELIEMPIMLIVIIAAARWTVRRFTVPPSRRARLGMGVAALGLMLAVEATVVLWAQGISLGEHIENRDPVAGTAYMLMLLAFAAMPLVVARR